MKEPTLQEVLDYSNELNLRIQDLEIKQKDIREREGEKANLPAKELLELGHLRVMKNWHEAYAQRLMEKTKKEETR